MLRSDAAGIRYAEDVCARSVTLFVALLRSAEGVDEQTPRLSGSDGGHCPCGCWGGQDVLTTIKMNVSLKKDAQGNARLVQNGETPRAYADCIGRLFALAESRISGKPVVR